MRPRPAARLRLVWLVVAVLTAVGLAAPTAAAGEPLDVAVEPGSAYPDIKLLVTLPGTVAGDAVTPAGFVVSEGGERRAAQITKVPGEQVEVMIVLDTSGSMQGAPIDAARTAAASFVDRVPPGARVGVVGFGSTAALALPLTTDHAATKAAIGALVAGGETALYDGVALALDQFPPGGNSQRHLVLLSDGGDTASTGSLEAVAVKAKAAGARVNAVALATGESDETALRQLSQGGGGTLARATDAGSLAALYDTLGRTVANQYHVTFRAQGHGATVLRVDVDAAGTAAAGELRVEFPPAPAPTQPQPTQPSVVPSTVPVPVETTPVAATSEPVPRWLLVAGAAAWFAALLIGTSLVSLPARRSLLAAQRRDQAARDRHRASAVGQHLAALADSALERRGLRGRLNTALERAGIELRPGEFLVIVGGVAVASFLLFSMLGGPLTGLVVGALGVIGAKLVVSIRTKRRRRAFTEQLGDALQMMSNSLRSGYAVPQAMNVVAQEGESPIRDEFRRVLVESRLGRDVGQALRAMADRVGGDDVLWIVQAMEINREVGGDLAEVLDNVAATIRARAQLRRQVQAVSAEGRLSAYVLVALPIVLAAGLAVVSPDYISELTHGIGLTMVGAGVVMLALGSVVLSRMVKIDF
jgi:tight adherence protein B